MWTVVHERSCIFNNEIVFIAIFCFLNSLLIIFNTMHWQSPIHRSLYFKKLCHLQKYGSLRNYIQTFSRCTELNFFWNFSSIEKLSKMLFLRSSVHRKLFSNKFLKFHILVLRRGEPIREQVTKTFMIIHYFRWLSCYITRF